MAAHSPLAIRPVPDDLSFETFAESLRVWPVYRRGPMTTQGDEPLTFGPNPR